MKRIELLLNERESKVHEKLCFKQIHKKLAGFVQ